MFWKTHNDQRKQCNNFYPKGYKLDVCSVPAFEKIEKSEIDLGVCGFTRWVLLVEKSKEVVMFGLKCKVADSSKLNYKLVVKANISFRVVNQKSDAKSLTTTKSAVVFNESENPGKWEHSYEKSQFTEKSGFLKNGVAVFHIQIGITDIEGIYSGNFIDFSIPKEDFSDLILSVHGKKFHVSKQILCMSSPVFTAMLCGYFNEKDKKEVEIGDIDLHAFHLFLQYIYMAPVKICEENVGQLLAMGDRFGVKKLTRDCESYLMKGEIDEKEVDELAIFYNMEKLLFQKMVSKDTAELSKWWSLDLDLPASVNTFLMKRLQISPKPLVESIKTSPSVGTESETSGTESDW